MNDALLTQIEELVSQFQPIPENRRYWLVRTESGTFYQSFTEHNYIALGYNEIGLSTINDIRTKAQGNEGEILKELRLISEKVYPEDKRPGLIASQIYRFIYEIKKGDIVVIPSESSESISIGIVNQTYLLEVTELDLHNTDCPYRKRKSITWKHTHSRSELDLDLYRLLQAHQAINDISFYSESIERTLGNFFIKDNTGNLVLNVRTPKGINAIELFQLGYFLLHYSHDFFKEYKLPLDIGQIEVKINLNSMGKIQLKSIDTRTIWLVALLVLGVCGGGLKIKVPNFTLDLTTDGVIKNVINYQNNKHDRSVVDSLMKSMDSLQVEPPKDALEIFKQFSTNKDLAD